MSDCSSIDPLITPFVDGDIGAADRRLVDTHVRVCAPCHSRVAAEQAVRDLLRARRDVAHRRVCLGRAARSVRDAREPERPGIAAWRDDDRLARPYGTARPCRHARDRRRRSVCVRVHGSIDAPAGRGADGRSREVLRRDEYAARDERGPRGDRERHGVDVRMADAHAGDDGRLRPRAGGRAAVPVRAKAGWRT